MNIDVLIFQQINGLAGKWAYFDSLGIFLSEYLIYILGGVAFLLFRKNVRRIIEAVLVVVLAKFGIVGLIRLFWSRSRPFVENQANLLISKASEPSFPSGHAAISFALSYIVYCYNKKAGRWFFLAAFLISISRVFVGVHWPSDILAGAIVGILSGWLVVKISKKKWLSF